MWTIIPLICAAVVLLPIAAIAAQGQTAKQLKAVTVWFALKPYIVLPLWLVAGELLGKPMPGFLFSLLAVEIPLSAGIIRHYLTGGMRSRSLWSYTIADAVRWGSIAILLIILWEEEVAPTRYNVTLTCWLSFTMIVPTLYMLTILVICYWAMTRETKHAAAEGGRGEVILLP